MLGLVILLMSEWITPINRDSNPLRATSERQLIPGLAKQEQSEVVNF